MTTTIIKHEIISGRLFATVVTCLDHRGKHRALFQVYSKKGYQLDRLDTFDLVLEKTESWSNDDLAINAMREWIDINTNVHGDWVGRI